MPRPKSLSKKEAFGTRLNPHLMDLLRQWAEDERRSISEQLSILIEQEEKRRGTKEVSKTGRNAKPQTR